MNHIPELHYRNDCCRKCRDEPDCPRAMGRCFHGNAISEEQCQQCHVCLDFTRSDGSKPYRTGLEELKRTTRINRGLV